MDNLKWALKIFTYLKNNHLNIVILVVSCFGLLIAYQSLGIQKEQMEDDKFPFFQYSYSKEDRLFHVSGDSRVSISSELRNSILPS